MIRSTYCINLNLTSLLLALDADIDQGKRKVLFGCIAALGPVAGQNDCAASHGRANSHENSAHPFFVLP